MFMKKNAYVPEDRNDIGSGTTLGKNFCLLLNLFAIFEKKYVPEAQKTEL